MRDKFTRRAFSEGYKARSVFKLRFMDQKFKLIKKGNMVLDLGAAPGSWSQYAIEKEAEVDAVDIVKVNVENVNFIKADIMNDTIFEKIKDTYDVVMSDAAPKTTGILNRDTYLSFQLSSRSLEIVKKVLKKRGTFICKIFQGEDFEEFYKNMKKSFKKVKTVKPEASRKKSKEIYLIGFNKV